MKFELFNLSTTARSLLLNKKTLKMHKKVMLLQGMSLDRFNIWIEGNVTYRDTTFGTLLKGDVGFEEAFTIMENYK